MPFTHISASLPDLTGRFIVEDTIELVALLGNGSFGKVYKGFHVENKKYLAVKCMPRYEPDSAAYRVQEREPTLHGSLSGHDGVIEFLGDYTEGDFVFAVLELAEDGDLYSAIVDRQIFVDNTPLIKNTMNELIDAGIFHRDLKPENILCDADGSNIRLADFGLSTRDELTKDFGCGTQYYICPESMNSTWANYSARLADLWALSVIFATMIGGGIPWTSTDAEDPYYSAFCNNSDYLYDALPITREASELLERCFHPEPWKRPTLMQFRKAVNAMESFTDLNRDVVAPPTFPPTGPSATLAQSSNTLYHTESSSCSTSSVYSDSSAASEVSTPPTSPLSSAASPPPKTHVPCYRRAASFLLANDEQVLSSSGSWRIRVLSAPADVRRRDKAGSTADWTGQYQPRRRARLQEDSRCAAHWTHCGLGSDLTEPRVGVVNTRRSRRLSAIEDRGILAESAFIVTLDALNKACATSGSLSTPSSLTGGAMSGASLAHTFLGPVGQLSRRGQLPPIKLHQELRRVRETNRTGESSVPLIRCSSLHQRIPASLPPQRAAHG
ncbi:kinase-like domain-containing protein [Roridomyces roridus]|uniref:Kinase-like domain-containing protein n=1 Tax=Roridomyces roridus TaxID=1738132 RepID=A0AAD7BYN3_9AGAR|nr:kinase-like domain-containing protein [Roridomyces roridus]